MEQKKTIDEIKQQYPGLECIADGPYDYSVGYSEPGDLFNVQGTGDSPDVAWQDAYECLTNTGSYSKNKTSHLLCNVSIDKNVDGTYYLYLHHFNTNKTIVCIEISGSSAERCASEARIDISEFPF